LVAEIFDQVKRAVDPRTRSRPAIKATGLLEVDAPERVLAIVFTNLLRNAMTYTSSGRVDV
jgi:signal transduction histidine kinase